MFAINNRLELQTNYLAAKSNLPSQLACLEGELLRGLDKEAALLWPERFISAITPGSDLSKMWPLFVAWLLDDEQHGLIRFVRQSLVSKRFCAPVSQVAQMYRDGRSTPKEWEALFGSVEAVTQSAGHARVAKYSLCFLSPSSSALDTLWAACYAMYAKDNPRMVYQVFERAHSAECDGGFNGNIIATRHKVWAEKLESLLREAPIVTA